MFKSLWCEFYWLCTKSLHRRTACGLHQGHVLELIPSRTRVYETMWFPSLYLSLFLSHLMLPRLVRLCSWAQWEQNKQIRYPSGHFAGSICTCKQRPAKKQLLSQSTQMESTVDAKWLECRGDINTWVADNQTKNSTLIWETIDFLMFAVSIMLWLDMVCNHLSKSAFETSRLFVSSRRSNEALDLEHQEEIM